MHLRARRGGILTGTAEYDTLCNFGGGVESILKSTQTNWLFRALQRLYFVLRA